MTASTPSFRPDFALAIAAILVLLLAACKPSTPVDPEASGTPAPSASTAPSQPAEMPAPATALASGAPAPTVLSEVTVAGDDTRSGLCSFDTVDGARFAGAIPSQVASAGAVKLTGWIGDDGTKSRPAEPALRLTGTDGRAWEIALGAPASRGDVAKHFETESMADSGFEASYDLSALPAGDYSLSVAYDRGSQRVVCEKGVRIHVGS